MDRTIVYTQEVPRSQDFLQFQKDVLYSVGYLAQAILGAPTGIGSTPTSWVDGLVCTPTSPVSLNVNVNVGSIYDLVQVDTTAYGVIPPDTNVIVKQGILSTAATLAITPPSTSGFSQVYLVQAIYEDLDGGPQVLPYFNSLNPLVPFAGPGNLGTSQFTVRQGLCVVGLKAGAAAPTGTQVAPPPDAGFVGLWTVTVSNGQPNITSSNIAAYVPGLASIISPKLTQVPAAIQAQQANYAQDIGTANAIAVTLPAYTVLTAGLTLRISKGIKNTGPVTINVNGAGAVSCTWADGSPLSSGDWPANAVQQIVYQGTTWQLANVAGPTIFARVAPGASPVVTDASLVHYGIDAGTTNAISCATVSPAISTSVTAGMQFEIVKINTVNTGAMTCLIFGTSGALLWPDGSAMGAGDWPAGAVALLMYDGTAYRMLSMPGPTVFARNVTVPPASQVHYGVGAGTNSLTTTSAPTFPSLVDGMFLELLPSNSNTGPVTLNANAIGVAAVQTLAGTNLPANTLLANQPALLMAIGGVWKLLTGGTLASATLTNIQVFLNSGTYVPTAGAQHGLVIGTGAGAAGGSGDCPFAGSGGGAGATAFTFLSSLTSQPIIIGAGGAPVGVWGNGGGGGTTTFGTVLTAGGGQPTTNGGFTASVGGAGGTASVGLIKIPGGSGGASWGQGGVGVSVGGGLGGASFWGGGGAGGFVPVPAGLAGQAGQAYGSGGGGGSATLFTIASGGAGAPGIVVVLEF